MTGVAEAGVTLTVESLIDGFSASDRPRLSWRVRGFEPGAAHGIVLEARRSGGVERSEIVDARAGVLHEWPFAPVAPRETVSLEIRVEDSSSGTVAGDAQVFTGGTLPTWPADFVTADIEHPVLLRSEFVVESAVRRATMYVSAFGAARARIDGMAVGDHELAPGWTSYQWRVGYDTYDLTGALEPGRHAIGLELFGAWFTERYGFRDAAATFYSGSPSTSAFVVVEYANGRPDTVVTTNADWCWARGAVRASGLYRGESVDMRSHPTGWDRAGFDDSQWRPVSVVRPDFQPTPRTAPPVRVTEVIAPVSITSRGPGERSILDFGQNLVGRLRLRIDAPAGTRICLRHAEVLQDGELATRPLRNAEAADEFIADGQPREWSPAGTFHGFRYAEISGWPGELTAADVVAEVLGTDLARIGGFTTSHPLLQRLHENVVWGARGNFLSIPTDCPQRDERLGWTGDVQVFAPTASFLFDCGSFLSSWLTDVRAEQDAAGGVVPMVVPAVIPQVPGLFAPIAAWGDAITVVPWALYNASGDERVLHENFEGMAAWVDVVEARAGSDLLWEDGRQFGDWLDADAPPDQPGKAAVDADIVATAYFFRSARLTSDAAEVIGRPADADRYASLAKRIRHAFIDAYVTPRGRMMSDAPTAYALAIVFGLVEDDRRSALGDRLAELVRRRGYRISTGFAGTPVICEALTSTGHSAVAGRLLTQTENPSWLYPVTMGATTIWERWDSLLEDGSLNPGQMTSFNHFALGAVAEWMHTGLAGLSPTAAGYAGIRFAPVLIDGVDDAAVWHDSPHGRIEASWVRRDGQVRARLIVPWGVRAEVELPGITTTVGSGAHEWVIEIEPEGGSPRVPSLDGPMTDVLDSPRAYRVVMEALREWDQERAARLRRTISWTPGRSLRDPLDKVPVSVMDDIQRRLLALAEADTDRAVPADHGNASFH